MVGLEPRIRALEVVREGETERQVEASEQERVEQVRVGVARVSAD